jgi:LysM repeat protein
MAERFFAELAAIPGEKWVAWRQHRVRAGETLWVLARRYDTSIDAIARANGLNPRKPLAVGMHLVIPGAVPPATVASSRTGEVIRYRVRAGDTLSKIAAEFGVRVADLKQWNNLRSDLIGRGALLEIRLPASAWTQRTSQPGSSTPTAAGASESTLATNLQGGTSLRTDAVSGEFIVHLVSAGETLWSIARGYQTTVEALRAANQFLFTRQLKVGDQLRIPKP